MSEKMEMTEERYIALMERAGHILEDLNDLEFGMQSALIFAALCKLEIKRAQADPVIGPALDKISIPKKISASREAVLKILSEKLPTAVMLACIEEFREKT